MKEKKSYRKDYSLTGGICRTSRRNPTTDALLITNMFVDHYGGSGALESVPGYRKILNLAERINGIYSVRSGDGDYLYVHSGERLFRLGDEETRGLCDPTPIAYLKDQKSYGRCRLGRLYLTDGKSLLSIGKEARILSEDARACGCRSIAFLKEKIFLSDNPNCPGVCFYSDLTDGEELAEFHEIKTNYPSSLLSCGEGIFLLPKESEGSLCRLTLQNGEIKTETVALGISAVEDGILLDGRLILICQDKILSLDLSSEKACRAKIISEKISDLIYRKRLKICGVFAGYLALWQGDEILLFDLSKSLLGEEEWYLIRGVGGHADDQPIYKYSSVGEGDFHLFKTPDAVCEGEVMSLITEGGEQVFYCTEGDKKYRLYKTERQKGGRLLLPTAFLCHRGRMWFGDEGGGLFVFNNDVDESEKSEENSEKIDYHAFDFHSPEYLIELHPDDCALPSLLKNTESDSFYVKLKSSGKASLEISVINDGCEAMRKEIGLSEIDFDNFDFQKLSVDAAGSLCLTLPENSKDWREKKIIIRSTESPLGIYSIGYEYSVGGRINKTI